MTYDVPQELLERVDYAVHLEAMRPTITPDDGPTPRTIAEAAITALLDGVTPELNDIHGDGSMLVVKAEAMMPITTTSIGTYHYTGTEYQNIEDAKAAALADYRTRLLAALTGGKNV